ncbi:hypothetical protein ACIBG6_34505 [Streptomyces sp. NPDC050842]|uniref:hypothetical protein n=1 Tax=Streptomyces sp. NPDC050842 TaxID=3365636 RepID=UPI0037AD1CC2
MLRDEGTDLLDDGDPAGSLALRPLVDEATRRRGGLAPDGPDPGVGVDVPDSAAGDLADSLGRAGDEADDIAPGSVLVMGGGHECVGQLDERFPAGQGECSRVEEFILGLLVELLPARHTGRVDLDVAVPDRLLHDADQDGDGVLDGRATVLVGDPVLNGSADGPVGDHPDRQVPEGRHYAHSPSCEIGIARLQFQSP